MNKISCYSKANIKRQLRIIDYAHACSKFIFKTICVLYCCLEGRGLREETCWGHSSFFRTRKWRRAYIQFGDFPIVTNTAINIINRSAFIYVGFLYFSSPKLGKRSVTNNSSIDHAVCQEWFKKLLPHMHVVFLLVKLRRFLSNRFVSKQK